VRRLTILVFLAALALSACGDTTVDPTTTSAGTGQTTTAAPEGDESAATTTAAGGGTTTTSSAPDATSTTSGRPLAPDFTLELSDGGFYTLSEGSKPVYLVFWAEW
jgi:hypothetical protein